MIKHISKNSWLFIVILSFLMATTSLTTDIYLPAMPEIAKELQGNSELTITGFLIGFSLAQLFWGPISDKIGRKKPLYLGVALFRFYRLYILNLYDRASCLACIPGLWCLRRSYVISCHDSRFV